ncbi:MAG: dihydroorotate dehydrogenase electron transfer subunit [Bacillota bacterium]
MCYLIDYKSNCYKLEKLLVIENREVAPGYFRLTLEGSYLAREAKPGQFVMVYMPMEYGYMLPRPFSIFRVDCQRDELAIFFQIKGYGTELLARIAPGAALKILGPLGKGFPPLPPKSLLAAGGMGIAPLVFLASSAKVPRTLIYGAPAAESLACPSLDLDLPGLTLITATEDGSRGEKGTVVEVLAGMAADFEAVFACGPRPMLDEVNKLFRGTGIQAWFSMEERMACGIGACLGCVVKTGSGYKRVCRDGPVFPAAEVF